ncbi:MAG: DUF1569 domain-containing protein [Vicinamibacterales bacterium]
MNTHLQSCLAIILDATTGVTAEAAVRRAGDRWSVVEIVEHLQRAYSGTAKGLERCLEKGSPQASAVTLRQSIQIFALLNLGYFPTGRQAPKHIIPTGTIALPEVIEGVKKDLAWLDAAAAKAARAFGGAKVMDHPILGAFTVDQWLRFHLVHTRHHEKQIRARR